LGETLWYANGTEAAALENRTASPVSRPDEETRCPSSVVSGSTSLRLWLRSLESTANLQPVIWTSEYLKCLGRANAIIGRFILVLTTWCLQ
jgi:hypothetical protein